MTSARLHTDQTHSNATPTESMVALPPHDACADPRLDDTVRIILPGPLLPPVALRDAAFMSPELLTEKLRALYKTPHYCRSVGCENVVEHCGDHCPRCVSEIEALRKDYAEQGRKASRIGWGAILVIVTFVLVLFAVCAWLGQVLRGWL